MVFNLNYNNTYKKGDSMEEEIYKTSELYGVFCNDGSFKIYHYVVLENIIDCLFTSKIIKNTIMKEEIKMFSPLVAYTPNNDLRIKSQKWMNGEVFENKDKYYRAIRLDIILNEILNINSVITNDALIKKVETVINSRLGKNIIKYQEVWNSILEDDKNLDKKRRREIVW